ncbi:MAG: hypothetical protein GTO30_08650 [Acidobacteria bacterium]|nr:hypothetical protein [Acidobacteriota bacterium]NIM61707.1 hypothetical protein [Acidobacteriota bacterium]NIO58189.1 hypothetical protein [Acidobacteriota bacterium]NIQ83754.1 hypothetical protein [Acidobacteriota bacterium]NIT09917.1 hypothetical protein [Acidobacteriota bacterium]
MSKPSILFVCTLRGGRARIGELFAEKIAGELLDAASACFEPGPIRGLPVQVMNEIGIELGSDLVPSIFQRFRTGRTFDYVVAMCDESGSELCDLFRRNVTVMYGRKSRVLRWDVEDFSTLEGSREECLRRAAGLRDRIHAQVREFLAEIGVRECATV